MPKESYQGTRPTSIPAGVVPYVFSSVVIQRRRDFRGFL
jgi:hypothetical protein